jgi:hypothetical protein
MKFPVFCLLAGNLAISETSSQLTPPSTGESANFWFLSGGAPDAPRSPGEAAPGRSWLRSHARHGKSSCIRPWSVASPGRQRSRSCRPEIPCVPIFHGLIMHIYSAQKRGLISGGWFLCIIRFLCTLSYLARRRVISACVSSRWKRTCCTHSSGQAVSVTVRHTRSTGTTLRVRSQPQIVRTPA